MPSTTLTYKSTVSVQQQQLHKGSSSTNNNKSNSFTNTLKFDDGAIQFRQRICVAILTHRRLLIRNIRNTTTTNNSNTNNNNNNSLLIGLQAHEASFLKLIDAMTNGSHIEINATGTQLLFQPGILIGGTMVHDCPVGTTTNRNSTMNEHENDDEIQDLDTEREIQQLTTRSIGWYLEGILPLTPFGKEPLHITFNGITDGSSTLTDVNGDPSCDYLRHTVLPLFSRFGIGGPIVSKLQANSNNVTDLLDNDIGRPSIKVIRRGGAPLGGGCIVFTCPVVRSTLLPESLQDFTDVGMVKRIRGTVVTCQLISSSLAARTAYAAKGICHRVLPDIWIHTDVHTQKNHQCGPSPSVNMILCAETTTGVLYASEVSLRTDRVQQQQQQQQQQQRELPEDLGVRGAVSLLQEIQRGGCIDTNIQSLTLLLMCLCPEQEVCRIRTGPLSPYTIVSLRLFQQAFGVTFKVRPDLDTKTVIISGVGIGYKNMARAST
jgi:RNA 3'-terminal phosphate cyclase-like protein